MGSYSQLKIGDVTIAEFKNWHGDFGWLFTKRNKSSVVSEWDIETGEHVKLKENIYVTKLEDILLKLKLLGYLEAFDGYDYEAIWYDQDVPKEDLYRIIELIPSITISKVEEVHDIIDGFYTYYRFNISELDELSHKNKFHLFDYLDTGLLLGLLSQNKNNLKEKIIWYYDEVVRNGWVSKETILNNINENKTSFLIITEGSSDTFILKKALSILYKDIAHYFTFIDMTDNYPFTGTGNLFKFCQGLSKIQFNNNVIVIFDNDTEGNNKYNELCKINLPSNFRVMKLPCLSDFRKFHSRGPTGEKILDINGKAVSIEHFLDLTFKNEDVPFIRWTNYDKKSKTYQGSLENKEKYIKLFKSVKSKEVYDFKKLDFLLNVIFDECFNISKSLNAT